MARLLVDDVRLVSMDPAVGEPADAAVLVQDGRIAAAGPRGDIAAPADAERIDGRGGILLPGLVDTHRHTWQTALRGICADWTLGEYFRGIRQAVSPRMTADDVAAGTLAGALEALDAGVTTLLDFSHCNVTPEHADAAVAGLRRAGIRGVFAYGYFPVPGPDAAVCPHAARIADARRVRDEHFRDDGGLLRMGVALTETGLLPWAETEAEARSARDLQCLLTAHTGCVWGGPLTGGVRELAHRGLLGPGQVHAHATALADDELALLASAGCAVSSTPETELQMGMGHPVIGRWLALGGAPALGADVVSANAGELFTQMRLALQFERAMRNDTAIAGDAMPTTLDLGVRDALAWATINGARALGLGDVCGSITPGKRADLVLLAPERLGMSALADPVAGIVLHAGVADVDTVLVDGVVVKRDGRLRADVAAARSAAERSAERVLGAVRRAGPLPPPEPEGFAAALRALAEANLAPAWDAGAPEA